MKSTHPRPALSELLTHPARRLFTALDRRFGIAVEIPPFTAADVHPPSRLHHDMVPDARDIIDLAVGEPVAVLHRAVARSG